MPTISGTVLDDQGNPVAGRTVRAYRRDTGALLLETATSNGTSPVDPDYANVSLLLHMDGANGSTAFTDLSPSPKAVSVFGNAQISTAQSVFGGASAYFDGAGDYITVPYTADFAVGSGDFTFELWVYRTGVNANGSRLWNSNGDVYHEFDMSIDGSGVLGCYGTTTGSSWNAWAAASIATITANQWVHIALVRNGGTVTVYLNGVGTVLTSSLGASVLVTGAGGATTRSIGGQGTGPDRALMGYIDEVRFTKGVARYTTNFTPPDAPFSPRTPDDPLYANVSLLLPMDGVNGSTTLVDRSPTTKTVTAVGGAQISTAQSKFGGASLSLPTSGSYAQITAHPNFSLATSDFTVEMWVYLLNQGFTGYSHYFTINGQSTFTLKSWVSNFYLYANSTTVISGTTSPPVNQWVHLALTRSGTAIRLFVNGLLNGSVTYAPSLGSNATAYIGHAPDVPSEGLNGYVDDFRFTAGVARYTADFTPPTRSGFSTSSLAVGAYEITTAHTGECNVVCLDDAAGTTYNDLILRTTPV
jgi:hypothetical protein